MIGCANRNNYIFFRILADTVPILQPFEPDDFQVTDPYTSQKLRAQLKLISYTHCSRWKIMGRN